MRSPTAAEIQPYLSKGFTKPQAEFLWQEKQIIEKKFDDERQIIKKKFDDERQIFKDEIKKLKGELIRLEALIYHRHDLAHLTPTNKHGSLTPTGKKRIENLRRVSPWKNMTEKEIRQEKQRMSERLHGVPPKTYKNDRERIETKFKNYIDYHSKPRSPRRASPNFKLSPKHSNLPKRYISAREVAKKHGLR